MFMYDVVSICCILYPSFYPSNAFKSARGPGQSRPIAGMKTSWP